MSHSRQCQTTVLLDNIDAKIIVYLYSGSRSSVMFVEHGTMALAWGFLKKMRMRCLSIIVICAPLEHY